MLLDLGEWAMALHDFDAALKSTAECALAYRLRGEAKLRLGDCRGALSDMDKAYFLQPRDPETRSWRDRIMTMVGGSESREAALR